MPRQDACHHSHIDRVGEITVNHLIASLQKEKLVISESILREKDHNKKRGLRFYANILSQMEQDIYKRASVIVIEQDKRRDNLIESSYAGR